MRTLAFQGLGRAVTVDEAVAPDERGRTALARVRQFFCGISRAGHQMILTTDRDRLFLVCRECLRETPGWQVAGRRPRVRFP
jgi:hypothetical protein